MGSDIHAYLEYDYNDRAKADWQCFCRVNFRRDYLAFWLMAGIRGGAEDQPASMVKPRGIPKDIAYETEWDYTLSVIDDEPEDGEERCCSKERAKDWLEGGYSEQWGKGRITNPDWHTPSYLSREELCAVIDAMEITFRAEQVKIMEGKWKKMLPKPKGCTEKQYNARIKEIEKNEQDSMAQRASTLKVITAAMAEFENAGAKTRLVFWFDN